VRPIRIRPASYERGGESLPGAEKTSKSYFGRVIYEDAEAKTIGTVMARGKTQAGFEAEK